MRRRRPLLLGALLAAALVGGGLGTSAVLGTDTTSAVTTATPPGTGTSPVPPGATPRRETAKVRRQDLVDERRLKGTLGYGTPRKLRGGDAVITALPEEGAVIEPGGTLWDVDGHAGPVLVKGTLPMWRELRNGVSNGADVLQLEQNLEAWGLAGKMKVDDHFDARTAEALKILQAYRKVTKTGAIGPGDVVVHDGALRVAKHLAAVGDPADGEVLEVTSPGQVVTMAVPVGSIGLLSMGAAVEVELPDDRRVEGTVTKIGRSAEAGENGSPTTIAAEVTLRSTIPDLDAGPVEVIVTRSSATGVLTVPIRALLALAEGGYAVEVVDGPTTRLVGVELGEFGDGVVAVTGDGISDGVDVVVAP